jgi:hypothetical protein
MKKELEILEFHRNNGFGASENQSNESVKDFMSSGKSFIPEIEQEKNRF